MGLRALLCAAAGLAPVACSRPLSAPVGVDGHVVARDFTFRPHDLVVQVGQQTSILFENEDRVVHNFTSLALGMTQDVGPGDSVHINFTVESLADVPEDLVVVFSCRFHAFEGMRGEIRVQP